MSEDLFKETLASLSKKGDGHIKCAKLDLNDHQLELLITALEHSPTDVKTVDVSNNSITSSSVACLVRFLETALVQSLDLHNNQIDEDGALQFLSLFEKETSIKLLDLRNNACSVATAARLYYLSKREKYPLAVRSTLLSGKASQISFSGMTYGDLEKELLQYLLQLEGLEAVDFSGLDLGPGGMFVVGTFLKDTQVSSLSFRECSLTNDAVLKFVEAADLAHHRSLRSFDFSSNMGLTNDLVRKLISSMFDHNSCITSFVLTATSITPAYCGVVQKECAVNQEHPAIKRAVVALRNNSSAAQEINLQWDAPLPTCMYHLADFIAASTAIQHLNISNTLVDDAGLKLLSDALQKNSTLKVIELANCHVTATGIQTLFVVLAKGKCAVEEVNIANNSLDDDSVQFITAALRANPKLTTLNVDVNPAISTASMQEMAGLTMVNRAPPRIRSVLPSIENNCKDVVSVDFSGNDVTLNDDSVWVLAQALRLNSTVRRLNLSHNSFGDMGASYLADYIASNSTMLELNLSSCTIGNRGAHRLCEALATNQTLQLLDLSNSMMDEDGLSALLRVLRENNTLRELKLERTRVPAEFVERVKIACSLNRECAAVKRVCYRLHDEDVSLKKIELSNPDDERVIDDLSVSTICTALNNNTFVEVIDLSGNHIGENGCAALAAMLSQCTCKVRTINLSKNPIDDDAVAKLLDGFPNTKTLREVLLYNTNITDLGIEILAKGLEKNQSIVWIGVANDDAVSEQVTLLKRNLALNTGPTELKHIILSIDAGAVLEDVDMSRPIDCSLDDSMCQFLCASLVGSRMLRSLKLSHNTLSSACVPYIVEVVELCPSLVSLDLSDNQIDQSGAQQIIACLERVSHLRSVDVTNNLFSPQSLERVSHLVSLNLGSEVLKKLHLATARGEALPKDIVLNGVTNSYKLTDEDVVILAGILQDCSAVKSLDLSSNNFSDAGCIAIAEVLRVNHALEALNLTGNAIGANGGAALYFALKVNPQLQHIWLENTAIPREILEDIASLLHVNQTPYRAVIDMRDVKLDEVSDETQFRSTDYYVAQTISLKNESIEGCMQAEVQPIK
ncbi:paraflagellar rod component, putative [Leishmania panamensis]|uniref:Paraflagellar rod component, putative n=1 Tax=Leishmania panamensis TaxID=5679 RepID=A0A088S2D8_LEIPA|nr:paraflagellar rod component, putative [Leishmania panamensis]AIO02568.1 paraflagellar rod component, putative [Leishmania panamensis]